MLARRFALVALFIVGPLLYAVTAQDTRPSDSTDAIQALVAELRAIRTDLAESSERGLRFQLLLARLQLQEQRIGHLDRQRADVVQSLMDAQAARAMFMTQFEQFERGCADTTEPDERKACESQIAPMKANVASHQMREQQLQLQEQELSQAIATEQNRWADFSGRLEELERALARPR
jgi:chromosome segregation ATPase